MKKLGWGSLSMLFVVLALVWNLIGDSAAAALGLPAWSQGSTGLHLTPFYSLILLIPAVLLGVKFPLHRFARLGAAFAVSLAAILCFVALFAIFG